MSFAYVRRHAPFPPASHISVSSNAVGVRYAVLGSPSRNQTYILLLSVETHAQSYIREWSKFPVAVQFIVYVARCCVRKTNQI